MKHSYNYEVNKLKPLKMILLVIAIFIDLIVLASIPSIILHLKTLYVTCALIVASMLFKFMTIRLTYTVEYAYYRGKLTITKRYYRKSYLIVEINKEDVCEIVSVEEKNPSLRVVNNYNALFDEVLVKTKNNNYLLSLDNTMIASLQCEEEYDLFR